MHVTTGRFTTSNGSKYLQQLCKHFAHKIEVSFTETEGTCTFELGQAFLTADLDGLTIRFELNDAKSTEMAHQVIDKHLERFAFRENFTAMDWSDAP